MIFPSVSIGLSTEVVSGKWKGKTIEIPELSDKLALQLVVRVKSMEAKVSTSLLIRLQSPINQLSSILFFKSLRQVSFPTVVFYLYALTKFRIFSLLLIVELVKVPCRRETSLESKSYLLFPLLFLS